MVWRPLFCDAFSLLFGAMSAAHEVEPATSSPDDGSVGASRDTTAPQLPKGGASPR
jgi:hypothetical protein